MKYYFSKSVPTESTAAADQVKQCDRGRWAAAKQLWPDKDLSFSTSHSTICGRTDHFLYGDLGLKCAKRRLLKNWLKQSAMQDLLALNSCWMMLSSFGSVIIVIHISSTKKIHRITDCKHLLQQRIKTEQNAFFAREWRSVNRCDGVSKLCYSSLIFCWSWNQGRWNLLLWLALVIPVAAWYRAFSGLWRVHTLARQCPGIHGALVTFQKLIFHKVL